MKKLFNQLMITGLLTVAFVFNSCQEEFEELPNPDAEQTILASSSTATLIEKTSSNDGSFDNVIDGASCFAIQFPYMVNANGIDITIDSMDDIYLIEELVSGLQVTEDVLEIIFPVTITFADFTELTINSETDWRQLVQECSEDDAEVIKCVDFVYPLTLYTFDINKQQSGSVTVESDKELRMFFGNLDSDDLTSIDFPILLELSDGSKIEVKNNIEMANALENAKDDCIEESHDDCENCTVEQLTAFLSSCTSWYVHDFELENESDLEQEFSGFEFSFSEEGVVSVSNNGAVSTGTWTASGTGNAISVVIDIPDYPNFNATWTLHSLEKYGDWSKAKLRFGDSNELIFKSNCSTDGGSTIHPDNLRSILKQCQWVIKRVKYQDEEIDRLLESKFSFGTDGSVVLSTGEPNAEGTWEIQTNASGIAVLAISIGAEPGISFEWPLRELENSRLEFGTESGYELTLEKSCSDTEGVVCTMEARAGLNVFVRIPDMELTSPEGITVKAVDGDYVEVLTNINPDIADYVGAFERKGNYTITVTKEGYQTFTSEVITVTGDQCHVTGRIVQVMLVAEE
jgi:hypothetical protein